jgi:hypothetical protein
MRLALWLVSSAVLTGAAGFMLRDGITVPSALFAVAMATMVVQLGIVIRGAERLPSRLPAWRLRPEHVRSVTAMSYVTSASLFVSSIYEILT